METHSNTNVSTNVATATESRKAIKEETVDEGQSSTTAVTAIVSRTKPAPGSTRNTAKLQTMAAVFGAIISVSDGDIPPVTF